MSRPHEASILVASHAGPAAAAAAAAGPEPGGGIASPASPKIDPRVQQALTWTRMAPGGVLPPPRSGAASVVVKGGLYMFGGYGGGAELFVLDTGIIEQTPACSLYVTSGQL